MREDGETEGRRTGGEERVCGGEIRVGRRDGGKKGSKRKVRFAGKMCFISGHFVFGSPLET